MQQTESEEIIVQKPKSRILYWLFPLGLYLLGAIIYTWPVALNLGQKVMNSRSSDVWQHLWNQWWMPFSLWELHSHPYFTPELFYPDGANLYFHALQPLPGYIGMPFQALFGLAASFVLVQFLQVTVAAFGAFLLARYLSGHYGGALVAGLIYGFCPLEAELLNLGQLELTSIEWLPFFVLFFLKTMRGEAHPWRNRILTALFLVFLSLTTWYYTLYALIFSGLYLLWMLVATRRDWKKEWKVLVLRYAVPLGLWFVVISPLLFFTIRDAAGGGTLASQTLTIVAYNSADLSGFFRPGQSAIWGLFGSQANFDIRGIFLGYAALLLGITGVVVRWKQTRFWLYIAAIFFALALGPVLHFSFDPNWSDDNGGAMQGLPWVGRLLYAIPLGNILRVPLRFTLIVMLALGICAAFAVSWLVERLEQRRASRAGKGQNWIKWAVPVVAGLLVFLEFLPVPRVLADTTVPQFYQQIRNEGKWNDFAIIELPDPVSPKAMYYQTVHQHPITTGYLSRKPASYQFFVNIGVNRELVTLEDLPRKDVFQWGRMESLPSALSASGIRYLVVHPNLYSPDDWKSMSERLKEIFGDTPPYYQDGELVAYRIAPLDNAAPDPQKLFPKLGDGWAGRNLQGDNVTRNIGSRALLTLTNPFRQPFKINLSMQAQSLGKARTLKILADGKQIFSQSIPVAQTTINVPLDLKFGQNNLEFVVEGASGDAPTINFAALDVK